MKNLLLKSVHLPLVLLFGYTGTDKLLNHTVFHIQLSVFPVIKYAEPILSWALPITELFTAFMLVMQSRRLTGFYFSLSLLTSFTIYLLVLISFGIQMPCPCGGVLKHLSWNQHIVFNLFFMALSIIGIYVFRRKQILVRHERSFDSFSHL